MKHRRDNPPQRTKSAAQAKTTRHNDAETSNGATFQPSSGAILGRMLAGSTRTAPVVEFDGNVNGPLRARTTIPLDTMTIDRAIVSGQSVVIVFEQGDPTRPIVTGLIQSDEPRSPLEELLLTPRSSTPPAQTRETVEAKLDGQRVVLEGKNEISLKCGEASITLRRDGKIIVRGAYVETHARGVNRIKGGAVKIN